METPSLSPIRAGEPARDFRVRDLNGSLITLEQFRGKYLLLSIYRSPDCPLCGLRLYQLSLAYPDLQAIGVEVVVAFEAGAQTVSKYAAIHRYPFALVPDPDREMFQLYAVRPSWWGMRGVLRLQSYWRAWRLRVGGRMSSGELTQLPADLLIGPDQVVLRAYYGQDVGDHLPLQEIIQTVSAATPAKIA
jgi:thioredoxin-dependent peroxiredoxin